MHIDLIGLPGSGKSTLLKEIVKGYRKKDFETYDLHEAMFCSMYQFGKYVANYINSKVRSKLIHRKFISSGHWHDNLLLFIAKNTELAETVLRAQNKNKFKDEEKNMVSGWLFDLFAQYNYIKGIYDDEINIVFDEGFVQRIVTLFGYGDPLVFEKEIETYIDQIPLPDLIFFIDSDINNCLKRISSRGYPERLKNKEENEVIVILNNCKKCINYSLKYFQTMDVPTVTISNNQDLNMARQAIHDFIINNTNIDLYSSNYQ